MIIEIENPHGYFLDSDEKVVMRFANYRIGEHEVPDVVEYVEYVDSPTSHEKSIHEDYKTDS